MKDAECRLDVCQEEHYLYMALSVRMQSFDSTRRLTNANSSKPLGFALGGQIVLGSNFNTSNFRPVKAAKA